MRGFLVCSLVISLTAAGPQKISFGGSSSSAKGSSSSGSVNTRLGLLATQLGLSPTATQGGSSGGSSGGFSSQGGSSGGFSSQGGNSGSFSSSQGSSAPLIDGSASSQTQSASGRTPSSGQQCCCVPRGQGCQDPFGGGDDLVGAGLIDPRLKNVTGSGNRNSLRSGISTRIVNRPVANTNSQQQCCCVPRGQGCQDPFGGSPLVCQSDTGRWTVVGLVTWGVGCGSDTPGVYANVGYFRNWINSN